MRTWLPIYRRLLSHELKVCHPGVLAKLTISSLMSCKSIGEEKVLFHYDYAPVHTPDISMTNINDFKFGLLPCASYSPDLISLDYFLFPNLQKWFCGKRCTSNEEVKLFWETRRCIKNVSKLLNILEKVYRATWRLR